MPDDSKARPPRGGRAARGSRPRPSFLPLGLAGALVVLFGSTPAGAQPPGKKLDEIAAVVGDQPILRSDVEEQFTILAPQFQVDPADTASSRQLRSEILNRMIDDRVLVLEAKAQNLSVADEEVREQITRTIDSNKDALGGEEGFRAQLQKEGMTLAEYEAQLSEQARTQMLASRLVQKVVRPQVDVRDPDVRAFYEENRGELPKRPRGLHVQDLFLRVRADSVLDRRAADRAKLLRASLAQGLSFEQAARENSDAPDATEGGKLGRFGPGELDRDIDRALRPLKIGEVSQPVRTRYGWHLLQVTDRAPDSSWVDVSHVLFQVTPTRGDEQRTLDRARQLRSQVVSGQLDFAAAIQRYSEDLDSRGNDGDLGWIPITGFANEVKSVVDTLRVGRISSPVLGDGGVHIFRLLGEEAERNYTFDEVQGELRQLAGQKMLESKLRAYVDGLRKKYFVEVRGSR